ncbi:hypothetical protein KR100_06120 [Synechococcus sp. KORDI-100]|nr:hypothetical protein KR100_06120 [Synechococcus sp. KORDI-100]
MPWQLQALDLQDHAKTAGGVFTGEIQKLPRSRRLLSSNTQETLAWCQCLQIDNV